MCCNNYSLSDNINYQNPINERFLQEIKKKVRLTTSAQIPWAVKPKLSRVLILHNIVLERLPLIMCLS